MEKILIVLLLAIISTSAKSEEPPKWGEFDGWGIYVDTSLGNGCFAFSIFEGDSLLRFGINNSEEDEELIYAVFGDPNWKSIEYGKKYSVEIKFGDEEPWSGDARGMSFDPPENQPYLWISVKSGNASKFFDEFMEEKSVSLFYNGSVITNLSLKGSYTAGLELVKCQKAMDRNKKDPFSAPRNSNDPFAT